MMMVRFAQNLSRPLRWARPRLPSKVDRPASGLPCHCGIEPSGKKAPLLEHSDQGHKMSSNITPLIPCLFADVVGHPVQLIRGAVRRCPAVLPRPLSSAAGVRALSRRLFLKVVRFKIDLLQAVPRPVLAEVHPREIGILSVIIDDPKASKLPRSVKNGRRRAIFRGRRAASRHAPTWKCSREGARHDPKAPVSLMHRGAVPARAWPRQVIRLPSWPRGEPHRPPRLERAHQVETR